MLNSRLIAAGDPLDYEHVIRFFRKAFTSLVKNVSAIPQAIARPNGTLTLQKDRHVYVHFTEAT